MAKPVSTFIELGIPLLDGSAQQTSWTWKQKFIDWETKFAAAGDVSGPTGAVDSDFAQFDGTSGKLIKDGGLSLTTDGTLAANSNSLIPSEKAVKTYVDAHVTKLNFADNETPSGLINSANTTYTLAHTPSPSGSLILAYNGVIQIQGTDYTLATATITMTVAPITTSTLRAWYRY